MDNKAVKFLSTLWQGGQYSYYWTAPDKVSYWFPVTDLPTQRCPNGGQNVYFGINPVTQIPPKNAQGEPREPKFIRSQNQFISVVNCLFCEFDFKHFGNADAIKEHLKKFPFPSIVNFSGGGYHLYWLLNETFVINTDADRERIRAAQANWVEYIGGDKQSKDLARVLRVPGTKNYKPDYAPNFPTVEMVKENYNLRYRLADLEAMSTPTPKLTPAPLPLPTCPITSDDIIFYRDKALNTASKMIRDAIDGEKHGTLLRAARLLGGYVAGGVVTEDEAVRVLEMEINHKANVNSTELAKKTIKYGLAYGKSYPITLEQKKAEREEWRRRNGREPETPITLFNSGALSSGDFNIMLVEGQDAVSSLQLAGFTAVGIPDANSFAENWVRVFVGMAGVVYIALDPGNETQATKIGKLLARAGVSVRVCSFPVKADDMLTKFGGDNGDVCRFLELGRKM